MTPSGVGSCFDATPANGCAYTDYCAYHSSFNLGSGRTLYANQPYPNDPGCDSGQQPNGDLADSTINLISHEHNETITDPRGNAWFDSNGDENGDKCAWDFGTALGSTAGGQYNQLINGGQYYLQREWSNAPNAHGCVLTMPNNAPAAVFTSTPSSPAPGQAVSFDGTPSGDSDGTISGYSWDYGDGATGTGAAPSHTYVTSGTYPAKLTVTDNDGTPTSVTHSVIVSQPSSGAPPGGPAPTPGGGQTPSNDSSPAAGSPPASGLASLPPTVARLDIPTQQLILSSARRTGVVVRCGTGRRCAGSLTVSVTIPATGRRGSRVRTVVLGRAGFSVAALHTVTVRFALSRMAASLLSGHRRIRVRAAAVVANAVTGRASVSRSAWLVPAAKTKRR
jgi:PKD repeat protein